MWRGTLAELQRQLNGIRDLSNQGSEAGVTALRPFYGGRERVAHDLHRIQLLGMMPKPQTCPECNASMEEGVTLDLESRRTQTWLRGPVEEKWFDRNQNAWEGTPASG